MATRLEEANIAPADNAQAILAESTASDKQPDNTPALDTSEKQVETATPDLGALSLDDKSALEKASDKQDVDNTTLSTGPTWPETAPDHPLTQFYSAFEVLVAEAQHAEVYGITLSPSNPFHTKLILQKFLRANANDVEKAKQQLLETLKWRKEFDPVHAVGEKFDKAKFGGLGYVLEVQGVPGSTNQRDVVTFNIYGAVKDKKATFGDLETYVRPLSSALGTRYPC
jgi:hypothetical protein